MDSTPNEIGDQTPVTPPASPMKLPPPPAKALVKQPHHKDGQPPADGADDSMARSLMSSIVDDGDAIEKDWVDKARQIVAANRNDPHRQSEEMMIFRADYMKKRYGKDIKLSK